MKSTIVRLPKTWPHVIRNGDVAVKIYKNKGSVRGETFPTFLLSYYASGKRQLRRFMDFTKASNAATLIAEQKVQGALGAAGLSAADRVSLEQTLVLLVKIEGIANASVSRLVEIIRDYTAARLGLPPGVTLAETSQFYKQKHPANMARKTVAEVVTEFIADRRSAGCRTRSAQFQCGTGQICTFMHNNETGFVAYLFQIAAPLLKSFRSRMGLKPPRLSLAGSIESLARTKVQFDVSKS
jgi:hypothetical protein